MTIETLALLLVAAAAFATLSLLRAASRDCQPPYMPTARRRRQWAKERK